MKKPHALALVCLLALSALLPLYAQASSLTDEDYAYYYEICEFMCADHDATMFSLLTELAEYYDMPVSDLIDFIEYAADADPDHVWMPVFGGTKYHRTQTCSKMIEPRPSTKDIAQDYGYEPCGRCKPGW